MTATLGFLYLAGAIVMTGFLIRQVITNWADRPIIEQAAFVAMWAVFWPLVPCVWLAFWWESARVGR